MVQERNTAINGGRNREILIGDLPQELYRSCSFGITFAETRNLSEAVENELDLVTASSFAQKLLHPAGAPQGGNVGMRDHQQIVGQTADEPSGCIHPSREINHNIPEVADQEVEHLC